MPASQASSTLTKNDMTSKRNMTSEKVELFAYDAPTLAQSNEQSTVNHIDIEYAKAKIPAELSRSERKQVEANIKRLLKEHNAVLVAHYYVEPYIQDLALETGGCVGDSLEMARFGKEHEAQTLVVAGVRFMGESAKILSMEKTVLMADLEAECSLDLGCPIDEFSAFCDQHPDRTVVVYANTSAEVKARADWVVTSSVGLEVVTHLHEQGQKSFGALTVIWANTFKKKLALICYFGKAPASSIMNLKPKNYNSLKRNILKQWYWFTLSHQTVWWPLLMS